MAESKLQREAPQPKAPMYMQSALYAISHDETTHTARLIWRMWTAGKRLRMQSPRITVTTGSMCPLQKTYSKPTAWSGRRQFWPRRFVQWTGTDEFRLKIRIGQNRSRCPTRAVRSIISTAAIRGLPTCSAARCGGFSENRSESRRCLQS